MLVEDHLWEWSILSSCCVNQNTILAVFDIPKHKICTEPSNIITIPAYYNKAKEVNSECLQ